jgi:hypothetical protein
MKMSGSYKLVLVPAENVRAHPEVPEMVAVEAGGYEVIADIGIDRKIRMSRAVYETVEVVDP